MLTLFQYLILVVELSLCINVNSNQPRSRLAFLDCLVFYLCFWYQISNLHQTISTIRLINWYDFPFLFSSLDSFRMSLPRGGIGKPVVQPAQWPVCLQAQCHRSAVQQVRHRLLECAVRSGVRSVLVRSQRERSSRVWYVQRSVLLQTRCRRHQVRPLPAGFLRVL